MCIRDSITILNPAPASEITKEFFSKIDYFTPNETEAEFYTGIKIMSEKEAKQAAEKLLNLGIKKVIITLGEKGLFYTDGKEEIYLKANPVKAIDTTGAGDAFNGSLAAALSRGETYVDSVLIGCATASISVTRYGTSEAMPSLEEVQKLIESKNN